MLETALKAVLSRILDWVTRALGRHINTSRPVVEVGHGIRVSVITDPREIDRLPADDRLYQEAAWLVNREFFMPFHRPPAGPPDDDDDLSMWRWAQRYGGVDVLFSHTLVLLQATVDRAIAIRRPHVDQHVDHDLDGIICMPEGLGGGNGILTRRFYVNLDPAVPTVTYVAEDQSEPATAAWQLRRGETLAFLVIAEARRGRHRWTMTIPATVDGHEVLLVIDDGGKPFELVGPEGLRSVAWVFDEQRWLGAGD